MVVTKSVLDGSLLIANLTQQNWLDDVEIRNTYYCKSLDDGRIVCGTNDGRIMIYKSGWERKDPRDRSCGGATKCVIVSTTGEGKFYQLSVENTRSSLSTLIPESDTPESMLSPTFEGSQLQIQELHALASGDIAVFDNAPTSDVKMLRILDKSSGSVKYTHTVSDKVLYDIALDPSRNSIFLLCSEKNGNDLSVAQLSSTGETLRPRIKLDISKDQSIKPLVFVVMGQDNPLIVTQNSKGDLQIHEISGSVGARDTNN